MTEDAELLRRYAEEADEAAFAEFVRRSAGLVVTSAARRMGGDEHRAREVAQQVFITTARHARELARHRCVTGWLFTTTRNAAVNFMRDEQRRMQRERAAAEVAASELGAGAGPDEAWAEIRPVLERAMDELSERDREAVLWRYFAGLPLGEIGRRLGLSENTARMHVQRALEKLNARLVRAGVTSTAARLGAALSTRAVAAVSNEVAAGLAKVALASATPTAAGVATSVIVFMSANKWVAGIASACALAGMLGTWTYSARALERAENELSATQRAASAAMARREEASRLATGAEAEAAALEKQAEAARSAASATEVAAAAKREAESDPVAEGAAFMARHPEVRRALDNYVMASTRFKYGALFRELGWSEAQIAEFTQLMGWGVGMAAKVANADVSLRYREEGPPENYAQRLNALLGAEGVPRFVELQRQLAGRYIAREVASAVYFTDTPLSPEQARELVEIVTATNPSKGVSGVAPLDWDQIVEKARGRLAPAQLEALAALRAKGEFQRVLNRPRSGTASRAAEGAKP